MDENDIGPWLRRKDSQPLNITVPHPPMPKPSFATPEKPRFVRKTRDASQNSKLEYYRKEVSEAPVRQMQFQAKSVWMPRGKLQAKTPDHQDIIRPAHRKARLGRTGTEELEADIKSSRSFTNLTEILQLSSVHDRAVIFHRTRDIKKAVDWSSKPPVLLPPLVTSYRRRTPLRWERAKRWFDELHDFQPQIPSRLDLQDLLRSRQMSPRP